VLNTDAAATTKNNSVRFIMFPSLLKCFLPD
jgi:hypothetical protein